MFAEVLGCDVNEIGPACKPVLCAHNGAFHSGVWHHMHRCVMLELTVETNHDKMEETSQAARAYKDL